MGYSLEKEKIFVGEKYRIFFKHKNIANYFCSFLYPLAIFLGFIITFSIIAPSFANEISRETKNISTSHYNTKTSTSLKTNSYCQSFLQKAISKNEGSSTENNNKITSMKSSALHGRNRAPVVLSMYLGVRRALGPTEDAIDKRFVQSRSKQQAVISNAPRALAIAAYRACEKEQHLKAVLPRSI